VIVAPGNSFPGGPLRGLRAQQLPPFLIGEPVARGLPELITADHRACGQHDIAIPVIPFHLHGFFKERVYNETRRYS